MRIGVVAPARAIAPLTAQRAAAFAAIAYPSVDLTFHPQCFVSEGHFAGSDAVRAAAFLEFANDPGLDAIWFARGGYGSNRILAAVMPQLNAAAKAKTYVGYSDMGFLLAALYARRIGHPVHGPMVTDINRERGDATIARTLGWLASRDRQGLEPGLGGRPSAAFNLSILTSLVGTPWLPDLTDHVLLIEDVGEPMYRIDRMLFQMADATQLKGLAGIRLGTVNDVQANDPVWTEPLATMIARWAGVLGVPYLGGALVGHAQDNHVVPFGIA